MAQKGIPTTSLQAIASDSARAQRLARVIASNDHYTRTTATIEAFTISAADNLAALLRDLQAVYDAQLQQIRERHGDGG